MNKIALTLVSVLLLILGLAITAFLQDRAAALSRVHSGMDMKSVVVVVGKPSYSFGGGPLGHHWETWEYNNRGYVTYEEGKVVDIHVKQ